jgi:pyruvate carboxylase
VFYEMNGEVRQVTVDDQHAAVENIARPKADASDSSQVGSPMAGVVVEVRVKDGADVNKGDPIAILSAMKMVSLDFLELLTVTGTNVHDRKWSSRHRIAVRLVTSASRTVTRWTRGI